jgi:hypothetical protein
MVIFTDNFIPAKFAGYTYGPISFIRPKYKDDTGLIEHEKTHQKQFWNTLGLAILFYTFSSTSRYKYELEAYRVQLKYSPGAVDKFALMLATCYNVNVTEAQARADLLK